nr:MAG TPA: hydrolase [Caudoviricetes sp.]
MKIAGAFSFALKIPKNSHFCLKTHARKTSPFMGGIECVSGCTVPLILEVVSCLPKNSREKNIPFYGGNRMRLRMHCSSYFGGCIMLENKFKTGLVRELKERFPGCMVVHLDPNEIQGIPDLLVLYGTTWGALEGKKSATASHRPNQNYYVQQMDEMSFAAFIYPENKEEVLNELARSFEAHGETCPPRSK